MNDTKRPAIDGIHHVKLPVSDLAVSLKWWESVFGARRIEQADHYTPDGILFAHIMSVPGVGTAVEIRLDPPLAAHMAGFDSVTLAAATKADLDDWVTWFDSIGIENSRVLRAISGWLVVVRDPDGLSVRIYSRETHEFDTAKADHDSPWITK
jgi:catechol 2,3-dioxygenase-like lactoylglutathione lyase family enzyme